jgi:hypothetical protein
VDAGRQNQVSGGTDFQVEATAELFADLAFAVMVEPVVPTAASGARYPRRRQRAVLFDQSAQLEIPTGSWVDVEDDDT